MFLGNKRIPILELEHSHSKQNLSFANLRSTERTQKQNVTPTKKNLCPQPINSKSNRTKANIPFSHSKKADLGSMNINNIQQLQANPSNKTKRKQKTHFTGEPTFVDAIDKNKKLSNCHSDDSIGEGFSYQNYQYAHQNYRPHEKNCYNSPYLDLELSEVVQYSNNSTNHSNSSSKVMILPTNYDFKNSNNSQGNNLNCHSNEQLLLSKIQLLNQNLSLLQNNYKILKAQNQKLAEDNLKQTAQINAKNQCQEKYKAYKQKYIKKSREYDQLISKLDEIEEIQRVLVQENQQGKIYNNSLLEKLNRIVNICSQQENQLLFNSYISSEESKGAKKIDPDQTNRYLKVILEIRKIAVNNERAYT